MGHYWSQTGSPRKRCFHVWVAEGALGFPQKQRGAGLPAQEEEAWLPQEKVMAG